MSTCLYPARKPAFELANPRQNVQRAWISQGDFPWLTVVYTTGISTVRCISATHAKRLFSSHYLSSRVHGPNRWRKPGEQ